MKKSQVPPVVAPFLQQFSRKEQVGGQTVRRGGERNGPRDDEVSISRDARLLSLLEESHTESPDSPEGGDDDHTTRKE